MSEAATSIQPADAALIARYADRRDRGAFELLVTRHAPLVFSVCRSVLGRHHDAEDAAQAAFLTLATRAGDLRSHPSVAGWLQRVAWHIALRARKARDLRARREQASTRPQPVEASAFGCAEVDARVHAALAAMPEKYRLPIVLHHFEGWSEQETAEVLGCRLGTISGRLSRSRRMLRARLERSGALAGAVLPAALRGANDASAVPIGFARSTATATAGGASAHVAGLAHAAMMVIKRDAIRRVLWVVFMAGSVVAIGGVVVAVASRSTPAFNMATIDLAALKPGWIVGVLTDPNGAAVPGAHVYVYATAADAAARRNVLRDARNLADGSFTLEGLPGVATYHVIIGIPYAGDPAADPQFATTVRSSAALETQHVLFKP